MLRSWTWRPVLCAAAAGLVLAAVPAAGWAQTAIEDDPVLGPLLDTLTEDETTSPGAVDAGDPDDSNLAEIDGFRSAVFGMTQDEVLAAIAEDHGIAEEDVAREANRLERTESLVVLVENLLPDSGPAAVVYIFGYQTRTLIQVDVLWGAPVDEDFQSDTLMLTGRTLQQFFSEQRYAEGSAFANVMLSDGTLVLFNGSDEQGRQATLSLVTREATEPEETGDAADEGEEPAQEPAEEAAAEATEATAEPEELTLVPVALRLSYVADPDEPDIFRIDPGDF